MRVYHFTNAKYGLEAIAKQRLRISRLTELNDPFEFLGVECSEGDFRSVLLSTKRQLSVTKGLLCFSKGWQNPVLWGHYADKHRGICLGFDFAPGLLRKVDYVNERLPQPDQVDLEFVRRLLFSKFSHWEYEREYRVYTMLDEQLDGHYFMPFTPKMKLKEVIVGSESRVSRNEVALALVGVHSQVDIFKARASFKSFRVVRNKKDAMWT